MTVADQTAPSGAEDKEFGRVVANAYYDYQRIRLDEMNRIRALVRRVTEGISLETVEQEKEGEAGEEEKKYADAKLFDQLEAAMNAGKITKKQHKYIKKALELGAEAKALEDKHKRTMVKFIEAEPVFVEYLSKIKGIGPVISANAIAMIGECRGYVFDIEKNEVVAREGIDAIYGAMVDASKGNPDRYKVRGHPTVSKLWAHAGQNVVDGKSPKRRKGKKVTYDATLKQLCWKISDSLMKSNKGYYRKLYDDEKKKQLDCVFREGELYDKYKGDYEEGKCPYKPKDAKLILGHAHNRALRKVRKHFLAHFWEATRALSGLPTVKTYVEGVLEHEHIVSWKDAIAMEGCLVPEVDEEESNGQEDA